MGLYLRTTFCWHWLEMGDNATTCCCWELRLWRHNLESQEVTEQIRQNRPCSSQFNLESDRRLHTGRSFQGRLCISVPAWLCCWWSFTRTKDIPSGCCRSPSMKSCLWDVDDGSGGTRWVLVVLHHWSGETFSQVLCFLLKCPWICQGCTSLSAAQCGSIWWWWKRTFL